MRAGTHDSDRGSRFARALFDRIASRYDFVNDLITLGQIRLWRRRLAKEVGKQTPRFVLDIGTGTGELALAVARYSPGSHVVGIDLSREMFRPAAAKLRRRKREASVSLVLADATALPFKDGAFDSLVNAFFLRHLLDLPAAFVEFRRVLSPAGTAFVLELTQPKRSLVAGLSNGWFRHVVPLLGGLASGDRRAYDYLPRSLEWFPGARELATLLGEAGFIEVRWKTMGLGTVALHHGANPEG